MTNWKFNRTAPKQSSILAPIIVREASSRPQNQPRTSAVWQFQMLKEMKNDITHRTLIIVCATAAAAASRVVPPRLFSSNLSLARADDCKHVHSLWLWYTAAAAAAKCLLPTNPAAISVWQHRAGFTLQLSRTPARNSFSIIFVEVINSDVAPWLMREASEEMPLTRLPSPKCQLFKQSVDSFEMALGDFIMCAALSLLLFTITLAVFSMWGWTVAFEGGSNRMYIVLPSLCLNRRMAIDGRFNLPKVPAVYRIKSLRRSSSTGEPSMLCPFRCHDVDVLL